MAADDDLATLRSRIQTMSLILSLVRPEAVKGFARKSQDSTPEDPQLKLLDRLSLLFVQKPGDVAAISTSISTHAIDLRSVISLVAADSASLDPDVVSDDREPEDVSIRHGADFEGVSNRGGPGKELRIYVSRNDPGDMNTQ
jgi:hypothetical protein